MNPRSALHCQFDHLVVAVRSLSEGMAEFARLTGIRADVGGKHPDRGTENALVSLGAGSYLEIIAPQAGAALAPRDESMRELRHLKIIDWAISVNDVGEAASVLGAAGFATTPPRPGSRVTPAGERLEWLTFDLTEARIVAAPFFIRWSPNTRHPSITAPSGCGLATLRIQGPASDRLGAALTALAVTGVGTTLGPPRIEATLTCGSRTAVLTT